MVPALRQQQHPAAVTQSPADPDVRSVRIRFQCFGSLGAYRRTTTRIRGRTMKPEERTFTDLARETCSDDFVASGLTDAELGEVDRPGDWGGGGGGKKGN